MNGLIDCQKAGQDMYAMAKALFPICRSITGPGTRETLSIIKDHIPIDVHEVPSGTPVLDWTVPPEWSIREAWIKDARGRTVVNFNDNNLHVVNYSRPVRARLSLDELQTHLHSLPDHPDWIPYRTTYYQDDWGFCLPHHLRTSLSDDHYDVFIDSELTPGSLSYGELVIPGASRDEFLISTHICHPSMANDNVSGIVVATDLARNLALIHPRYTYRFLFIPGTIGSITWLAMNRSTASNIKYGLVLSCLGDDGPPTYKKTRSGNALIDRAVMQALERNFPEHRIVDFSPYGYDERQFGSPGFNLPVGLLTRSSYGAFPEYHTSADNLDVISPASLGSSLALITNIIKTVESNEVYINTMPFGEPQLGRRGLYRGLNDGVLNPKDLQMAMLWVLNKSDGLNTLPDIATESGLDMDTIRFAADRLINAGLLHKR